MGKRGGPVSTAIKLKHRGDIGPLTASSKFCINVKNRLNIEKWDLSSSVNKKIGEIMMGMSFKANSKN